MMYRIGKKKPGRKDKVMQLVGIGQDSHRFEYEDTKKKLVLCGVIIPNCPGLDGNSDADVALHALTNAISGITTINILGSVSDKMCLENGIKDSSIYVKEAMKYLENNKPCHLSLSFECKRPHLTSYISEMRDNLSKLLSIAPEHIGITATTGEELTAFGRGDGIFCTAVLTTISSEKD